MYMYRSPVGLAWCYLKVVKQPLLYRENVYIEASSIDNMHTLP